MTDKFVITGMTCAACAAHVERAAASVPGVHSASVNLMLGSLVCDCDDGTAPEAIIAAVQAAGYGAVPESAMRPLVWIVAGAACFCGGRAAVRKGGDGALPRALAVSACVYGAMWLAALTGDGEVQFAQGGTALTCAVWGGGLLAGLVGVRRRKKKPADRRRRSGERRKRAVT